MPYLVMFGLNEASASPGGFSLKSRAADVLETPKNRMRPDKSTVYLDVMTLTVGESANVPSAEPSLLTLVSKPLPVMLYATSIFPLGSGDNCPPPDPSGGAVKPRSTFPAGRMRTSLGLLTPLTLSKLPEMRRLPSDSTARPP